jgi:membrane fusion protein (multidrug efflux system)
MMDGDLRSRFRRPVAVPGTAAGWGYSAIIPAELGYPQTVGPTVAARAEAPQRTQPTPAQRQGNDEPKQDSKGNPPAKKTPGWKKALYWLIGLIVVGAMIVGAVAYYLYSRHYQNTDDAFIDGHQSQVSAQVEAKVIRLAVQDNQLVRAGDPILQLDPRDYQVKLDQARAQQAQAAAQLQQAQAGLLQQQANVDQAAANVRVSEADLSQQQTDLNRYRAIDPKAITRQQLDTSSAQTRSAQARLDANRQAVEAARANIESQKAQIAAAQANLKAADATVENALLQLGYTTVLAPDSGRITRRTVELGNYVKAGQSLLAIVPEQFWVTANFKETQLDGMKQGQPVDVAVDACPGRTFPAHVDSFQTGTGAVFSSLPAENATGNYVKVVQRVPVKIVFDQQPNDAACHLSLGMSVSPRVTVR